MQEITQKLKNYEEVLWVNPKSRARSPFTLEDVQEADRRLRRFASFLKKEFPSTRTAKGIIESPLTELKNMSAVIPYASRIFVKQDNALAIAGSVKARGGIYEILKHAEDLALQAGLIDDQTDYKIFATKKMKQFLSQYTVQVATTGNLGLSIGIISAHLGFKVKVHMSNDAKAWKKALLRSHGVEVIEYASDYSKAVEKGRKESNKDPKSYFVDDERSANLFLGYAVAALRLKEQLETLKITPTKAEPLYVSIPCGVGGAPGGIAYGLKLLFKDTVRIYFAEPTHAPCMLIGMMSGKHDKVNVYDYGLDGVTIADGLAVGKASSLVGKLMMSRLEGIFTVTDEKMLAMVKTLYQQEGIKVEPSATAGFFLPEHLRQPGNYLFWSTGGSLVPEDEFEKLIR